MCSGHEISTPFGAGDFSTRVGRQRGDKTPFARHLPGGKLLEQELFQHQFAGICGDDSDDGVHPFRIAAGRTKDETLAHLRMREQRQLNGFRGNFPARDIDLVAEPAAQKDLPAGQLGEVAGLK